MKWNKIQPEQMLSQRMIISVQSVMKQKEKKINLKNT